MPKYVDSAGRNTGQNLDTHHMFQKETLVPISPFTYSNIIHRPKVLKNQTTHVQKTFTPTLHTYNSSNSIVIRVKE